MSRRVLFAASLVLVVACDGGPEGGCEDECATVGETRCDGEVIEACGVAPETGCLAWRAGLDCGASGATCDDSVEPATCVSSQDETCDDAVRNQDETDVDCGGFRCDPCELGQGCERAADCQSDNCDTAAGVCVEAGQPTCTDETRNQDETDVDCGGETCDPCGVGRDCAVARDCQSELCEGGTCQPRPGSCTDGEQNQDETDVDCGGETCDPCAAGRGCERGEDCASGECEGRVCVPAESCTDGVLNGDETDTDCGGGTCEGCELGGACVLGRDCASGLCEDLVCVAAESCTDGLQNQDETDVDCGGTVCAHCPAGSGCIGPDDCAGGYCVAEVCRDPGSCDDGLLNQDETDVDCGGAVCAPCANGFGCLSGSDCRSGACDADASLCVTPGGPTCSDGLQNRDETDVDCGGAYCAACGVGEGCVEDLDCDTLVCDLLDTHTCTDAAPRYLVDEDFETGDFSLFPYVFGGSAPAELHPFTIETDAAACHGGSFCMRSSRSHALGETTSIAVSLSVRTDTTVTFWVRTDLEDGEHFFRFFVDGSLEVERTGVSGWELVTATVPATGAGGPDRELRWEYSRSTYVSPDHLPRYEVWVDDIDMPDWNTEPSVPELVRPTNGQLTTDTTPTFAWRSFDPDFDVITFEMQYDVDPTFPLPFTTGETNDTSFTPPTALADGVYFWRVRAKDDSNYRWSAWSPVYAAEVNAGYEYAAVWRQTDGDQFAMNDLGALIVEPGRVVTGTVSYGTTVGPVGIAHNGGTANMDFTTPPVAGTRSATLRITASGDFDAPSSEYASVYIDGTYVGQFAPGVCSTSSRDFTISDVGRFVNDGAARIAFTTTASVDRGGCTATETVSARLEYTASGEGWMSSVPIRFSTFEGRTLWEKIQVVGTGTITVQVLDEEGTLVPDSAIPGNSAGLTDRTIRLFDLDPMVYPVIRLRAVLSPGAALDEWTVVGNDAHEWRFSNDGDAEGWIAADRLGSPAASVSSGVLRFTSTAAGEDPRIEYTLPQPVAATRFTTVEVRLRTSTTFFTDDPSFWWWSNYGAFDVRRSIALPGEFLVDFQDLAFDLTTTPVPPAEPWRGDIEAIRLDPVDRFVDEFGAPADGWFEVDRIVLR